MRFVDLTGQQFGRLIVLERYGYTKDKHITWLCECQCEQKTKVVVSGNHLKRGIIKSCGCLRKECTSQRGKNNIKHGQEGTRIYKLWATMKKRCVNPNDVAYKNYGGRGIKICDEWLDFSNFYEWAMNNGYEDTLTIERKDVNGNYCPENCKWATMKEQSNNKRNNHYLEYNGEIKTISQWADKLGISKSTISSRIELGWSTEDILTKPVKQYKRKVK